MPPSEATTVQDASVCNKHNLRATLSDLRPHKALLHEENGFVPNFGIVAAKHHRGLECKTSKKSKMDYRNGHAVFLPCSAHVPAFSQAQKQRESYQLKCGRTHYKNVIPLDTQPQGPQTWRCFVSWGNVQIRRFRGCQDPCRAM